MSKESVLNSYIISVPLYGGECRTSSSLLKRKLQGNNDADNAIDEKCKQRRTLKENGNENYVET